MTCHDEVVVVEIQDRVATIRLNRPDKYNAISMQMAGDLTAKIAALEDDAEVGVIVIAGVGRAFCAGGDVQEMASMLAHPPTLEDAVDGLRAAQEFCWKLHHSPKITIAAVNGFAMGAGLGIALSCDLRLASRNARFGTAYAHVGLSGDFGTTWQLTRIVGAAKAKEMFVLGDVVDADEALRIGLVNRVMEVAHFEREVAGLASKVACGPLVAYRYMKENINLAVHSDFRTVLDREAITHIRCSQTEDYREGAMAFVQKRKPVFHGK